VAGNAFDKSHVPKYFWFRALVLVGAILGVTLLVQAFRNYSYVSELMVEDQARTQTDQFVSLLERELRLRRPTNDAAAREIIGELFRENSPAVQYLRVFDLPNTLITEEGTAPRPGFTAKQISEAARERDGISEPRASGAGQVLLRVSRLRAFFGQPRGGRGSQLGQPPPQPPPSAETAAPPPAVPPTQAPVEPTPPLPASPAVPNGGEQGRGGPGFAPPSRMIEVAVLMDHTSSLLNPLRRNLIISCTAAIALLSAMALLAFRFRNYVTGKQLEEQLAVARRVQQDLLPSVEQLGMGADISARCVPAWDVGGDFYDVFPVGDGKMALVLGDISGKGLPASLLMGLLHGAVRMSRWAGSAAEHEESSRLLNHLLCVRTSQERYACMFWGYYDPSTHILRYINAGHLPPLLVSRKPNGEVVTKRLEEGGPVLGLVEYAGFHQAQVEVGADDLLILYSDGVGEAMDASGTEFGEERLVSAIAEKWDAPAGDIRDNILARVSEFLNGLDPHDDQTLMVARLRSVDSEHQRRGAEEAKPESVLA